MPSSPSPPYAFDDHSEAISRKQRRKKAIRVLVILALVVLFFLALLADVHPLVDKTMELVSDSDDLTADESSDLPDFASSSTLNDTRVVEGGKWATELHSALNPVCDRNQTRQIYPRPIPLTGFVSFPRSGNSYIRTLVERSTGYLTSSRYCDKSLVEAFPAECNHDTRFFIKTHYPALHGRAEIETWHTNFERFVEVVRNPLDCIFSYWQFQEAYKTMKHSKAVHTARVNVTLGETEAQVADVKLYTYRWLEFYQVWHTVPVPKLLLRYEDLRTQPLASLLNLVRFLLPEDEVPSLQQLACALELDEASEAYHSAKRSIFSSFDNWTPELRKWVVQTTAEVWCRNGYGSMLQQMIGEDADDLAIDCASVRVDTLQKLDTKPYYDL